MQTSVERKRAVLINTAYVVLLLSAFYLFMKYAFWIFAPFIFAFILGAALQRPRNAIIKKTPLKKGLTSVLLVLLTVGAIVALIALAGVRIAAEFRGLVSSLMEYVKELPNLIKSVETSIIELAQKLPDGIRDTIVQGVSNLSDKLLLSSEERMEMSQAQQSGADIDIFSIIKTPLSGVWATAKQIPSVLVGCLVFVIAGCFITSDYDMIVNFVKRQLSPEKRRNLSKTKGIVFSSIGKLVKSYLLIMLITFAEMCVGIGALKVIGVYSGKYIFIIALITAIVDIFPVLGTGTIIIPWAVISLITGSYGMGIGLLALYACITVIRQVIEPKIVASNLGIPPIVSIMGMYIGLQLFGVIGLFLMPITITVIKVLNDEGVVRIWKKEKKNDGVPNDSNQNKDTQSPQPEETGESEK